MTRAEREGKLVGMLVDVLRIVAGDRPDEPAWRDLLRAVLVLQLDLAHEATFIEQQRAVEQAERGPWGSA